MHEKQQILRIGTRGSALALWQANFIAKLLQTRNITSDDTCFPPYRTEICVIHTSGDLVQNEPIVNIGAPGVFTKEIQRALLEHKIDVAVHSLKDLPTEHIPGLSLIAATKRESYCDAFVSLIAEKIEDMPEGSRIGTGSMRRQTQIYHHFGNRYRVDDIRGNVETRLRKMEQGEYDALILAESGLQRLGLAGSIRSLLEPPFFLPAVGQGALGLEIRSDDQRTAELVLPLNDELTCVSILAERAMLRELQGGCSAPIAALGTVEDSTLTLHGRMLSLDGKHKFDAVLSASIAENPEHLGKAVAESIKRHSLSVV